MTIYLHSADNTRKPGDLNDPSQDDESVAEHDLNPPCVLVFNASDPSGAGGLGADALAMASVGAHILPVVTGAYARDTAEIFDTALTLDRLDLHAVSLDGKHQARPRASAVENDRAGATNAMFATDMRSR